MTIIFINRFFYPDHSATSQMLSDLAFALAEDGQDVCVLTSRLTYDGRRKLCRRETIQGVKIIRLPTSSFGRMHLAGRALDYATFYLAAIFSLLWRARRGVVVVAMTDPPMLSVISAPICALRGARSVNWLQDLFPEAAERLGFGRGLLPRIGFLALCRLRNPTLRHASLNIVLGLEMAETIRNLGIPEEKVCIIPNWAQSVRILPVRSNANPHRKAWTIEGAFVIGYSGNLGRAHSFETFLAAIEAFERGEVALGRESVAPNLRWLFIGGGAGFEAIKQEVKNRQLKTVLFRPYQPIERLSETLSLPDVHLISLRPAMEGLIVPSKYYGIAAAGRPAIFVGDPGGEIARVIEESATGFVVREGDKEGLIRAILALWSDPGLAEAQGRAARQLFEARFDFPHAFAKWQTAIANVSRGNQFAAPSSLRPHTGTREHLP
jgi:colanic acid biosynthesis glycosyl transferase WcaI